MSNVKIIEREGKKPCVYVSSSDNDSFISVSYDFWQDVKDYFDIDENTIDAYDYVRKYIYTDAEYVFSTVSMM